MEIPNEVIKYINETPEFASMLWDLDMMPEQLKTDGAIHGLKACYVIYINMKQRQDSNKAELNKIIEAQRHELSLLNKFREEDKFARQMLDKNACQRRMEELEEELAEANKLSKQYKNELDMYSLKNEFDYFKLASKLLQPVWGTKYGMLSFGKFIPTGDCEFYDYGSGFHYVTVCCVKDLTAKYEDKFMARIYYCTPDDGDYGGWGKPVSKEEAEKQVKAIGDIYVMLNKLPSGALMNYLLKDLNIKVGYE